MRRTVRLMQIAAMAACCFVLSNSFGCVQKQRIYSEPARYDHGSAAQTQVSAPTTAGYRSADIATQELPQTEPATQPVQQPEPTPQLATATPTPASSSSKISPAVVDGDYEVGLASWIADDFHGLRTAGGELYDKDALTGSHRTLPMNTRVEVTNLETGRFTVVRINDRGPFKKDRIIDVSHRAAEELGMIASGLIKVRLRVLDGQGVPSTVASVPQQATTPEKPVPSAQPETGTMKAQNPQTQEGPWFVQVGAFQDRDNAKQVLAGLYASGYAQSRISRNPDDGLYRVQAGSFASRTEAEAALEKLKPQYTAGYVINSDSIQP